MRRHITYNERRKEEEVKKSLVEVSWSMVNTRWPCANRLHLARDLNLGALQIVSKPITGY